MIDDTFMHPDDVSVKNTTLTRATKEVIPRHRAEAAQYVTQKTEIQHSAPLPLLGLVRHRQNGVPVPISGEY